MRDRLSQLTQFMQAPSTAPEHAMPQAATPTPPAAAQHAFTACAPYAAMPASSSSATPYAQPAALTTPDSEKALARRHRMLISQQMIEPN
eukprot:2597888-Pleurochrysis_carterae.AAC.1